MKKVYFIIPIVGCILFGALYLNFRSHNTEVEAAKKAAIQKAKDDKLAKEIEDRKKAYDDAIALQEKRKKEKEAKEEIERLERETKQALLDERERVFREQDRAAELVRKLDAEIKVELESVAKLQEQIKRHQAEVDAQNVHVAKAQANEKSFEVILAKIDAVDKAAAAAATAAANAAKKS